MIATQNSAAAAGRISGELSYAYRDEDYDARAISESLMGTVSEVEYQEWVDMLGAIAPRDEATHLLLMAIQMAQEHNEALCLRLQSKPSFSAVIS